MNILYLMKGHDVEVMTDAKVEVTLTIDSVEQVVETVDLSKPSRDNDWYPNSYEKVTFKVKFTNGFKKTYRRITDITLKMNKQ